MIIIAARCDNEEVGEYLGRPYFRQCITLISNPALKSCAGIVTPVLPRQIIMEDEIAEDEMRDYYNDIEERLFMCLKFGQKQCK